MVKHLFLEARRPRISGLDQVTGQATHQGVELLNSLMGVSVQRLNFIVFFKEVKVIVQSLKKSRDRNFFLVLVYDDMRQIFRQFL